MSKPASPTILPRHLALFLALALLVTPAALRALPQEQVTTPLEQFGFNLGDDYHLANYQQLVEYWQVLDEESDRMSLEVIGETEEGQPMYMAILTSPDNHESLQTYKDISRRLSLAEGIDEAEARTLASQGKAVVWIDGGLHATETLGAQQLMELVYQLVARDDPETLRILDDVIVLAVCVNPDGLDLVADWYMRNPVPEERSTSGLPRLYQKYTGHDNNRDFYMSTQSETIAINRILYREWFPQIVYNHHQSGPAGTVLFAPPFRDPFNFNLDPLVILGIERVGNAMHTRFVAEDKPGATTRSGASYSTWWNGGLRTTPYWHNQIGLLTETIGSPNPSEIPLILRRQLPDNDLPYPIAPQTWHFRQSVEYSLTANYAVLDIAAKLKEDFLFNIWRMGMNSIERGRTDTWTRSPARASDVERAVAADQGVEMRRSEVAEFAGGRLDREYWEEEWLDPADRDPRGYVIPSDQPDFLTAVKFVNTLVKNGVQVHRATSDFTVAGTPYPAGSFVVQSAQAFRPFVLDMFEPQHHPDDFAYPGAPPTPPYDVAGWTVAYQMGIQFDPVLEGFDGPFEEVPGLLEPPAGAVAGASGAAGFLFDPRVNDSFHAVNRLLAAGDDVQRFTAPVRAGEVDLPAGAFWVAAASGTVDRLETLADDVGVDFHGVASVPRGETVTLRPVRIGLWDRYGGDMPSGWTRWVLEQFEFPFEVVYPPRLDRGDLTADFDVLVFMDNAIPEADEGGGRGGRGFRGGGGRPDIPAEYQDRLGSITVDETIPHLREFVEAGGTIVAVGDSAMNLTDHFDLPVDDHLVERDPEGGTSSLGREQFYVPGSILQVHVDSSHPLAWGMGETADVFFRGSPVFRLEPTATLQGVDAVAWFGESSLRSGWAWGETFLEDGVAALAARHGAGNLFLFGPEVNFRAQPHGTFKLLFNGIYGGSPAGTTTQ